MRRPRIVLLIIAGCVLTTVGAEGQSVRSLVHSGNDQYEEKKFDEAEVRHFGCEGYHAMIAACCHFSVRFSISPCSARGPRRSPGPDCFLR